MVADRLPARSGGDHDDRRRPVRDGGDSETDIGSLVPLLRFLDFLWVLRPLLGGPWAPVARGMGVPLGIRPRVLAGRRRGRDRGDPGRPRGDYARTRRPAPSGLGRVSFQATLK